MVHLILLLDTHHYIAVHLHKAAVAIPRKPTVAGGLLERLHGDVIESKIQDGVHHARHGITRA